MSDPSESSADLAAGDELLHAGAHLIRDDLDARDEAWARYSAGELDTDQVRASLSGQLSDADIEAGLELFAPLDAKKLQSMTESLAAELEGQASKGAPVIELGRSRAPKKGKAWVPGVLIAAAAAAIVGLWFSALREPSGGEGGERSGPKVARVATFPSYELVTDGGSATTRAGEPTPSPPTRSLEYNPGDRFNWALVPEDEGSSRLALRAYVFDDSASAGRELVVTEMVEVQRSAIRVGGVIDELGLAPGRWTVVLVLAAERAQLPNSLSRAQLEATNTEGPWRAFRVDFELLP